MSTPRKIPSWCFATTTERDNYVAAQGVLQADLCVVDSTPPRVYAFDGSAWNPYPWGAEYKGTGSVGEGTTNDRIRRWDNHAIRGDTSVLTYTDSVTLGGYWTTAREGIYTVSVTYRDGFPNVDDLGINNAAALSNTFLGAHLRSQNPFAAGSDHVGQSWTGWADAATLIWISTAGALAGGGADLTNFQVAITQNGYLA